MYAIELAPEFAKQANALHPKRYKQIHVRLFALQLNPRPPDCIMLDSDTYRVHVGPYTIIYEVDDSRQRVRVFLLEQKPEE
jgi:mRNA-degrading endonuclease RelE of RelBE toxin-antitoxin system